MLQYFSKYKPTYYGGCKDLLIHTTCFITSFYSMWYFRDSYLSLLTIPLQSLMILRTFIIFHDCGHNSYTPNKRLNYVIGSILGIFVNTPFCWNYDHHYHHLTSGNKDSPAFWDFSGQFFVDHSNQNETVNKTLKDYNEMGNMKYIYRILRDPLVFFTVVPPLIFFIKYRCNELLIKYNNDNAYKTSINIILFDTILNNLGIFLLFMHMDSDIIYHYLISQTIAFSIGLMIFHNEHTFNPPYVVTEEKWNKKDSGLLGSSFIQVPNYLRFFTLAAEYHHIHHANSSIPGYNLPQLHEELKKNTNELDNIIELSMNDFYKNLWLTLYDEENNKYISFAEADKVK